jgi:hypothetical protein
MSDFFGAAVNLIEYVVGTQTKSSTSTGGVSDTLSNATATVSQETDKDTSSDTSTSSSSSSNTHTATNTVNSADPEAIATLKSLANQAISNSNDPSKTTGLLSGLLQNAGDAMTAIFGQQKQAGVYNSSATSKLTGDVISRAAADAASAILGFQVTEQNVGADILKSILGATATQSSTTDSSTNTQANAETTATSHEHDFGTSTSSTVASTHQESLGSSSTSGSKGMSVICTWMCQNGLMNLNHYVLSADSFDRLPSYQRDAYQFLAIPIVSILEKRPDSYFSKIVQSVFAARARNIAAARGLRSSKKSWKGQVATALVYSICFLPGLYFYSKYQMKKLQFKFSTATE